MENVNESGGCWWCWAAAGTVQLAWGIYSFRKGYAGDSRLMPVKAFGVASLFVGATATAAVGTLSAYGVHSVNDAIELGERIRTGLGVKGRSKNHSFSRTNNVRDFDYQSTGTR